MRSFTLSAATALTAATAVHAGFGTARVKNHCDEAVSLYLADTDTQDLNDVVNVTASTPWSNTYHNKTIGGVSGGGPSIKLWRASSTEGINGPITQFEYTLPTSFGLMAYDISNVNCYTFDRSGAACPFWEAGFVVEASQNCYNIPCAAGDMDCQYVYHWPLDDNPANSTVSAPVMYACDASQDLTLHLCPGNDPHASSLLKMDVAKPTKTAPFPTFPTYSPYNTYPSTFAKPTTTYPPWPSATGSNTGANTTYSDQAKGSGSSTTSTTSTNPPWTGSPTATTAVIATVQDGAGVTVTVAKTVTVAARAQSTYAARQANVPPRRLRRRRRPAPLDIDTDTDTDTDVDTNPDRYDAAALRTRNVQLEGRVAALEQAIELLRARSADVDADVDADIDALAP